MPDHCPAQPGRRICVVGSSGSGKSTVAQRLAETLGLTYICNDAILWGPHWTMKPNEQRLPAYDRATQADGWTFDGNVGSLKDPKDRMILQRADTLVWLDLPWRQVFGQVLRRTCRRAWTREPLWHGNRESWRLSFFSRDSIILWSVKSYAKRRRQNNNLYTHPEFPDLQRIRLTSRRQVDTWLASLG